MSALRRPQLVITIIFFVAIVGLELSAAASTSNSNNTIWQTLRIGGGGYVTGLDISADGSTRVVRTDSYGAYVRDSNNLKWTQVVTTSSMPAVDIKVDNNAGVYEIRVAPNLATRLYMAYQGLLYRSDDRARHWKRTDFASVHMEPNDKFRNRGQKMAVDPDNSDVVYVGTPQNGLFVTTNGGTSWQSVSTVPVSQTDGNGNYPGISGITFDPALGATGGKTNTIFAASYGHGVYESTNAGASWSSIGGPSDVSYATVSRGVYYVAANGNSVWSYANGTWTKLTTSGNGIQSVAVNPFNPDEIVAQNPGGSLDVSYDGGATWSGLNINLTKLDSTDIPWLSDSGLYMTIGGTVFDPLVPNELWASSGVGVWNTIVPTSGFTWRTVTTWNDQSLGIEQLVANQILAPPSGHPLLASWDRPVFYVNDPAVFPSNYGPDNQNAILMGWALDYASADPNFIVGLFNWGIEKSGYSRDGGRTWKPFPAYPPTVASGKLGGGIASSTPMNIVWAPSNNSPPYYTKDGGVTWTAISINGVPNSGETGWGWAYYLNRHVVTADRIVTGTFYIYNYLKGLYRSSDGGATWLLVHPGAIAPWSTFNATLQSVPDHAGHLLFSSGAQTGDSHPATIPLMRSTDGGETWTAVPNVFEVRAFGFGKALTNYPTIFIVGWVNRTYGIWRSDDNARSWIQIGDYPLGSLDGIKAIAGDMNIYGTVYLGFGGSGYAYGSLEK